jgi:hypothetical protein
MFGAVPMSTIGARSRAGSYGSFEYMNCAVASGPVNDRPIVVPSGVALATASVPAVPPACGRFSAMTGWPSRSRKASATSRPSTSIDEPGGAVRIRRIVLEGEACARSDATAATVSAPAAARSSSRRRGRIGRVRIGVVSGWPDIVRRKSAQLPVGMKASAATSGQGFRKPRARAAGTPSAPSARAACFVSGRRCAP